MILRNAVVHPMDAPVILNGFVRIQAGKIEGVGEMALCPAPLEDEQVLELAGKDLYPGFLDVHSHLGLYESGLNFEGDDLNEETDPSTPHLRALDGINPLDSAFTEAVDCGVTCAVVSPGSANPVAGQICALKTYGRQIDRMLVSAPLAIKLALGENPKAVYENKAQTPVTRMATAAIIREQLMKAQRYLQEKETAAREGEGQPELDMKCEALAPLLNGEIRAHIHAHRAYDILTGVRIAKEFGLRYTVVHGTEGHLIADILGEEKADVVCGPIPCSRMKPELSNLTLRNPALLAAAGVRVAVCTDHPEVPVDFLAGSAAIAAANGLEREKALAAITIEAARAVELDGRLGSITPGKDADLLVFDQDPFGTCAKPVMVWIDGQRVK